MGFKIRNKRKNWRNKLPPEELRILVVDAIDAAGNASRLAHALGITRSAVYQWKPPYREDPYMPWKAAQKFLADNVLRKKLELLPMYQMREWDRERKK